MCWMSFILCVSQMILQFWLLCLQTCAGRKEPGEWAQTPDGKGTRYLHSANSLAGLMREVGFAEVSIKEGMPGMPRVQDPRMDSSQMVMLQYTALKPR